MGLVNTPIQLEVLDAINGCSTLSGDNRGLINHATYLSGLFVLTIGHRELIGLALLASKAMGIEQTREETSDLDARKRWSLNSLDALTDYLLDDIALGSIGEGNILSDISDIRKVIDSSPATDDPILSALNSFEDTSSKKLLRTALSCCGSAFGITDSVMKYIETNREEYKEASSRYALSMGTVFSAIPHLLYQVFSDNRSKDYTMVKVWDLMANKFAFKNTELKLRKPSSSESKYDRRNRRCMRNIGDPLQSVRYILTDSSLEDTKKETMRIVSSNSKLDSSAIEQSLSFAIDYAESEFDSFVPMTFMDEKTYQLFRESGMTSDYWRDRENGVELSKDFYKATDLPDKAIEVRDSRLYGEYGKFITHGCFIHRGMADLIGNLAKNYGNTVVAWDRECLKYSSACINDSILSSFVTPASDIVLKKMIVATTIARILGDYNSESKEAMRIISGTFGGLVGHTPRHIELQMHGIQTTSSVSEELIINF